MRLHLQPVAVVCFPVSILFTSPFWLAEADM